MCKEISVQSSSLLSKGNFIKAHLYTFTANAARDDLLPYFNETIAQLKNFLTPNKDESDQENKLKLQVQAIGK